MPLINLETMTDDQGFKIDGSVANGRLAAAITSCDLDGDGIDEIISTAPIGTLSSAPYNSNVYVLWGGMTSASPNVTADIAQPNGFKITHSLSRAFLGSSVACIDMNQDGHLDLVIGANGYPYNSKTDAGALFVIYQYGVRQQLTIDLTSFPSPTTPGFIIGGENASDQLGFSVANAGDVNGDGFDDLVVGAAYANSNNGNAYVIYSQPAINALDLANLNAATGFKMLGTASSTTGWTVAGAGDMNNDGFDEVLIGAKRQGGSNKGAAYIVFGKPSRATPTNLATVAANDVVRIDGTIGDGPRFGWSVAKLNFNGDAYSDIIIGAPFANSPNTTQPGAAYILLGKANFPSASVQVASLSTSDGFALYGPSQYSTTGYCVASGDLNGDGLDDVVIGTPGRSSGKGGAYVFYGRLSPTPSTTYLASMNEGLGYQIVGQTNGVYQGYQCSIGNIRSNSHLADVLLGAPLASPNGLVGSGSLYAVYSQNTPAVLATTNNNLAFTADHTLVIDDSITITDVDNLYIASAQVKIASGFNAGDVLAFVDQNGISGSYNATSGILDLAGIATKAHYQAALRTVTYRASADNSDRTISFMTNGSNVLTQTLYCLTNILSGGSSALMCFNESNDKLVVPQLAIRGGDTLPLDHATVAIVDLVAAEDSLEFNDMGINITGDFDNNTGILTLSGAATASEFEAALRMVKYKNSNNATVSVEKTFSVAVGSAGQTSTPLESFIDILTVNDRPMVVNPVANMNVTVDEFFAMALNPHSFNGTDPLSFGVTEGNGNNLSSLYFNQTTNELSGSLNAVGESRFSFFAKDACQQVATSNFTINALAAPVEPVNPVDPIDPDPLVPSSNHNGAIIGGVVGGIAALMCLGGIIVGGIWGCRKKQPEETATVEMQEQNVTEANTV